MAIENIVQQLGWIRAAQDLTNHVGKAVRLNSFQRYQLGTTGEDAHGILRTPAQSGQVCDVVVFGVTRAIAGEAIPAGRPLSVAVDGTLVESNGGAIVAYSMSAATAAGDLFEVFVGARGGVNVILDSDSGDILPGETKIVDAVSTDLVRAATWLVTVINDGETGTEYFQVNAAHIGGDVSHQRFGWVKVGNSLTYEVTVVNNTVDNLLELTVENTGLDTLQVKALQIRSVAV